MRTQPWSKEQAWAWYDAQPWIRGCNYMPASCANRVDQWQALGSEERFAEMERELEVAESIGFNTLRILVELQGFGVWLEEHDGFMERFERCLDIMSRHGMRAIVVLGNDCMRPKEVWQLPKPGPQHFDIGYHGGRKLSQHGSFPGAVGHSQVDDPELKPKFFAMCKELLSKYRSDGRILFWNLWNEPGNSNRGAVSVEPMRELFELAWRIDPEQPLAADLWTSARGCNPDSPNKAEVLAGQLSDIISYHCYGRLDEQISTIEKLRAHFGRPMVNTEWLARIKGNDVFSAYPLFRRERIGCTCWGFVAGKYQTFEPWESMWKELELGTEESKTWDMTKWFHDLYRPSLRPYDPKEIEVIKRNNAEADAAGSGEWGAAAGNGEWGAAEQRSPSPAGRPANTGRPACEGERAAPHSQTKAPHSQIVVDPAVELGPVKPVNGVGQPPVISPIEYPMFHYLREAGIPFSRLHDVGGMFGKGIFVDIPNLFRDFDADENDPANYDFAFTDLLIGGLVAEGIEPFFRLGTTIENYPFVRRYRIDPPKDFSKWARICEHVIRHYTEGWACGFRHKITHWEIWNEPENWETAERNECWHGSFEEYCRLYEVASKHLKAAFPHLKIGGFASCGVGAAAEREDWHPGARSRNQLECFHYFLRYIKEHDCPIDFFSYHSYAGVGDLQFQIDYVREHLDKAGYPDVPTCLNEWLPAPDHEKLGTALQASEVAATLLLFQNGPVDSAAIYDARCGTGTYSPLFNPLTYKPHKAYWAFVAFNELRKRGTAVKCEWGAAAGNGEWGAAAQRSPSPAGRPANTDRPACEGERAAPHSQIYSAAARGGDGSLAVMLANPGDSPLPFTLEVAGPDCAPDRAATPSSWTCRIVDDGRTWEDTPLPTELPPHSLLVAERK